MSALQKAEQAAWEAPELRPTFTRDGDTEKWSEPCPDWCTGEGPGHELYRVESQARQHEGHVLRVRQDAGRSYEDHEGGADGLRAAHLAVSLVAGSRNPQATTRVKINIDYGKRIDNGGVRPGGFAATPLYLDEVRELITVLQHLLKVAGA